MSKKFFNAMTLKASFAIVVLVLLGADGATGQPVKKFVEANTDTFSLGFFNQRHKVVIYHIKAGVINDSLTIQSVAERIGPRPQKRKGGDVVVVFSNEQGTELERFTIVNPLLRVIESDEETVLRKVRDGTFEISLPADYQNIAFITLRFGPSHEVRSDVRGIFKKI